MGSVLVRDLLFDVSAMLLDVDPQFTVHSERELVGWLNDAQVAIATYLPTASSRIDVVRLQPGTRQSIEALAAADVKVGGGVVASAPVAGLQLLDLICNMGTNGSTPGKSIPQPVDRRILDASMPTWHGVEGPEVKGYTFDPRLPRHFHVFPAVPATRLWVSLSYCVAPMAIPAGGAPGAEIYKVDGANPLTISLADDNRMDLIHYCCARAFLKKADSTLDDNKVAQYSSLFMNSLNARAEAATGVNPNLRRLPFAPAPTGAAQ